MTSTGTPKISSRTKALLLAGVVAGPLFVTTVVIQELTRAGFDPKKHPLSMLSLGDLGWLQITNFILCGALAFVSAFGLRRVLHPGRGGTWGPILIGVYGIGLIWGGVFSADPALGYPIGAPEGQPEHLSLHGTLHAIAPAAAGIALLAACFVFARRFAARGQRGWVVYCVIAAVADLGLTIVSLAVGDFRPMLLGGAIIWTWAAAVTARVMAD